MKRAITNPIICVTVILVCLFNITNAATITSTSSGNFNDPGTWAGGQVPGASDSAVIATHTVTVTADDTVGTIMIYSQASFSFSVLEVSAGNSLTVNGNVWLDRAPADPDDLTYSTVTLKGTLITKGDLHLSNVNGTSDLSTVSLKLLYANGSLELAGGISYHGEGGIIDARDDRETTVKFIGSNAQVIPVNSNIEYYNIVIENTSPGGVSLGGSLNSANAFGNITINNGKFQNSGYSIAGIGGYNFTVKDGTTFILTGTTGLPSNFNHVIESGSIVEYSGSNQSIADPNNSQDYHHLTIGGSGTKTLTDNLLINGDLTLNSSTLDVDAANNYTIEVKGNWVNSGGTFEGRSGSVTFSGTSHTLTGASSFSGTVYVPTGTTLNTGGNLTLKSGASLMSGTGTPGGGGTVSGSVTVQRSGSGGQQYNYWAAPVSGSNVSVLGSSLYYYDPSNATGLTDDGLNDGWVAASGNMTAGLGYTGQGSGTVSFNGSVNDAPTGTPITVDVKKNVGTGNNVPYNLVGNPFPSGMDASDFMAVNGPAGNGVISGSLYFWDDDGSGGSGYSTGDYAVWTGAGSVSGPNSGTDFDGHIASGQSFFVEKLNDGTDQIEFQNSMRSTTNDAFFRNGGIERLWISLTNDQDAYNETLIAFIEDATDTVDLLYDARKLRGNPDIALYTKIDSQDFAIQALPPLVNDRTVIIGIDASNTGNYTLNLSAIENIDESIAVILEDTQAGTFINLRKDSSYSFSLTQGTDIQRFKLHFNPALLVTINDESCDGGDGQVIVEQPGAYEWNYILTNNQDVVVDSSANFNGVFSTNNLNEGVYHLTFSDNYDYQFTKSVEVAAKTPVFADFDLSQTIVDPNTEIQITDRSMGAVQMIWDFGDGTMITNEPNPTHTYTEPGSYTINLQADNEDCSDAASKTVYVTSLSTAIADLEEDQVNIYSVGNTIKVDFGAADQAKATVSVYNMLGQRIEEETIEASGHHEIQGLEKTNQYFVVRVRVEDQVHTKKVLLGRNR